YLCTFYSDLRTTQSVPLSLHDALPISGRGAAGWSYPCRRSGCLRQGTTERLAPVCPEQCGLPAAYRLGYPGNPHGHGPSRAGDTPRWAARPTPAGSVQLPGAGCGGNPATGLTASGNYFTSIE